MRLFLISVRALKPGVTGNLIVVLEQRCTRICSKK